MSGLVRTAFAAVPLAIVLSAVGANANQLINGDFSQGPNKREYDTVHQGQDRIADWSDKQNSVDYITGFWQQPGGARASIDLNGSPYPANQGNDQAGQLQQVFPTTAGASYTMSFQYSANPECNGGERKMRVRVGNVGTRFSWNVGAHGNTLSNMQWTAASVSFTAKRDHTGLSFTSLTPTACGNCKPTDAAREWMQWVG